MAEYEEDIAMDRYLHLIADCDPSGNPQQLFAVWHGDSPKPDIIDKGYGGTKPVRGMVNLGTVRIPKSEYHRILKEGYL